MGDERGGMGDEKRGVWVTTEGGMGDEKRGVWVTTEGGMGGRESPCLLLCSSAPLLLCSSAPLLLCSSASHSVGVGFRGWIERRGESWRGCRPPKPPAVVTQPSRCRHPTLSLSSPNPPAVVTQPSRCRHPTLPLSSPKTEHGANKIATLMLSILDEPDVGRVSRCRRWADHRRLSTRRAFRQA